MTNEQFPSRYWYLLAAAVLAIGVVAGLFAVRLLPSSDAAIDSKTPTQVESDLAADVTGKTGHRVVVTCPAQWSAGEVDSSDCLVSSINGSTASLHVRRVDSYGNIQWRLDGTLAEPKAVSR